MVEPAAPTVVADAAAVTVAISRALVVKPAEQAEQLAEPVEVAKEPPRHWVQAAVPPTAA